MAGFEQNGRMDFFGEQRIRTRRSLLLYGLFLLIVLAHMVIALGIMALLLTIFTGGIYHWVLILVIIWTLFSFIVGSFLEYRRLKAGGRAIAQRVGAVRLFIDSSQEAWEHSRGVAHQHEPVSPVQYTARHIAVRDERDFPAVYRRYYEFAQQLAIASGLSMPILYVLPNEQGINGFVAGRHPQDMVLVVTQGALDKLSDEALYGLIGHEYGHILHGDATFNLQLMVVLAGLQLLYDWSDSINNFSSKRFPNNNSYFDTMVSQNTPQPQREIDAQARHTETQTANFTTHAEWVSYWQTKAQQAPSSNKVSHSSWQSSASSLGNTTLNNHAPRSVWTLLLHGLSFSSMASAQLIKHSFNRQRELLADATSVQLTRSPAILETLKAIHQDALGSRLSDIADINGLSHFFFASSGADLGDVSWFATHPSLPERMSAINASAYQHFARQVAKQQHVNQQKIKEIYEQRRLGNWGNRNPSNNTDSNQNLTATAKNVAPADVNQHNSHRVNNEDGHNADAGLTFTPEADIIINGRLQVDTDAISKQQLLPWQALPDKKLPIETLMAAEDIPHISLPQYLLNHSYHPLGAQALIEAVLLCHQGQTLSTRAIYSLDNIWCGLSESYTQTETLNNTHIDKKRVHDILPHSIDPKLLEIVATLDRRLDSALIIMALNRLREHDLSALNIERLQQKSALSHRLHDQQYYQQQVKCRTMLMRYQDGLISLFNSQLTADLTNHLRFNKDDTTTNNVSLALPKNAQKPSILSLWQTLHLQPLLSILSQVLDNQHESKSTSYQPVVQAGIPDIIAQLDPSGQILVGLSTPQQMMLILFAYRLAKDVLLKNQPEEYLIANMSRYITDLRRHTRLIDIDLTAVSDANLQWLLLTAQGLNSIQLLAIIEEIPVFVPPPTIIPIITDYPHNKSRGSEQIAYNTYRRWLSTLHTVMLHDTIISQDEYDCLTALAMRWLGVRQLYD